MPIKYILIILLVIILLGVAIYLLLNSSDYNFTDIKSTSNNFNVNGVAAYSSDKNSIYISKIEYLDGDEEEKKKFIDYVTDFEYEKLGIKKPDSVIFLSAPFEVVNEMRRKRKLEKGEAVEGDIHENNLEFLKKVYDSAIFVAKYLNWDIIDCSDGNKMKSPEDIHEEIMKLIL